METIFGLHHDTASLREKNHRKLQKIESQEYLGLTNKNSVENTTQKNVQTKQTPSSNYFEKFGSIQSIFRDRFSISPSTTPHSTPPTSRPSTPLSFDVQQSGDNLLLSDQANQTIMTSSPLARTACYHHDPKIFQNVKSVLPCVEDIENDIINRPSSRTKSEDEFGKGKEENLFKKN